MTTSSLNSDLSQFQSSDSSINLAATVKLTPSDLVHSMGLEFTSSDDDLGSLIFTKLDLSDGNTVSLVHRHNAPYPGIEIYLSPHLSNPTHVLLEAFNLLGICPNHVDWIHPQLQTNCRDF